MSGAHGTLPDHDDSQRAKVQEAPAIPGVPPGVPEERREVAEYALLGLLREGPRHGYRLAAAFAPEGRLGIALRLKMSQMYAYLRKLERQGLLLAHDELDTNSHRSRRVFALTPEGERTFDAWLAAPVAATREVRLAFLLKLAFTLDEPAVALALIERQRAATADWLARQRSHAAQMPQAPQATGQATGQANDLLTITGLTLRHRILLCEATLAWLDETAAALRSFTLQRYVRPPDALASQERGWG